MTKKQKKEFAFSIRQKILGSFAFVLLISFMITAANIFGLRDFYQHFRQFKQESADTHLMLKIDKNVSELQRYILAFSNTEKGASSAQLQSIRNELSLDIDKLLAINTLANSLENSKLAQMRQVAQGFSEKIENLERERSFRESLVNEKLGANFDALDVGLDKIFQNSGKRTQKEIALNLWSIQRNIADAETLSGRYFVKREFQLRQRVIKDLQVASSLLRSQLPLIVDLDSRLEINSVFALVDETILLFNKAVQADRNYLFLVNVVIAGETSELSNLSESLKSAKLQKQNELFLDTEKHIALIQNFYIFVSLVGVLIAAAAALIIGSRISQPLQSITHTFSRLVSGEALTEIPGMNRNDEIGQLALAANIFRKNTVRTQELLSQTEKLAENLTQREKALELAVAKAQDANLAKSQFLANMSHELRTPMNAILGMLFLLQKTDLNFRQTDYAVKTEGAARSLLSLLNDILDLSKAEAGKMELDPIPFNLEHVFRDLNVILATNLVAKSVELDFSIGDGVPHYLFGDALRLKQVLINLGGNAIKFTERGSVMISVTQTFDRDDQQLLNFFVRDTGIGIAPESQEKIFSSFTQAEASTTRRFGGTGLGLAISQRLVALMGGTLILESELGKGSCFHFSIKLPSLSAQEIEALNKKIDVGSLAMGDRRLEKMRVLLVEDNPTNQQIAVELLEAEGAKVQVANHGQEAVDILADNIHSLNQAGFDVVLMDLQMPVMDGLTATREIRNTLSLLDLPIVAMTANAMASDREACINASMNDHIGKPFDISHVIQVLRKHAGWKALDYSPQNSIELIENNGITNQPANQNNNTSEDTGLDIKTAIARMGGNKDIYSRMLPKFIENLTNQPIQLRASLEKGELQAASRLLHSLKGLSSTMGATKIAAQAAQGEKLLLTEISMQEASQFIEALILLIEHQLPHVIAVENSLT